MRRWPKGIFHKHLTLLSLYPIKRDSALKRGTIRRAKPKRLHIEFSAEFVDALGKVNPHPSCRTQFPSWDGETKWSSDLSECWSGLFAFRPENATIFLMYYRGRGNEDAHPYPALKDGAIDTHWPKGIRINIERRIVETPNLGV